MHINDNNCSICWETLNSSDDKCSSDISTLKCGHPFHRDCISQWVKPMLNKSAFAAERTCPVCRNPLSSEELIGLKKFKGKVVAMSHIALWTAGAAVCTGLAGACAIGGAVTASSLEADDAAKELRGKTLAGMGMCGMAFAYGAFTCIERASENYNELRHSVKADTNIKK